MNHIYNTLILTNDNYVIMLIRNCQLKEVIFAYTRDNRPTQFYT